MVVDAVDVVCKVPGLPRSPGHLSGTSDDPTGAHPDLAKPAWTWVSAQGEGSCVSESYAVTVFYSDNPGEPVEAKARSITSPALPPSSLMPSH